MTIRELIERLQQFPPDAEAWWHDAIEGNDCPVENVGWTWIEDVRYENGKEISRKRREGVAVSPLADFGNQK